MILVQVNILGLIQLLIGQEQEMLETIIRFGVYLVAVVFLGFGTKASLKRPGGRLQTVLDCVFYDTYIISLLGGKCNGVGDFVVFRERKSPSERNPMGDKITFRLCRLRSER